LAVAPDYLIGIAPAVVGVVIVVGLILAVGYGRRKRAQEPPPSRSPQPGAADVDPVGYEQATREPEEVERVSHGERRRPHEIRPYPGPRT
jgi:hypothetical protein